MPVLRLRPDAARPGRHERGVALVITLLMLVLITVMAVAFLLLSQRETASVGALHSTTDAELAADAALERSKAIILAPFVKSGSGVNEVMGRDLFVSLANTNWPDYTAPKLTGPVNANVSPPVIVSTNRANQAGPLDNRFFLDLNRNGYFEESGPAVRVTDDGFQPLVSGETASLVGDPMWIGLLQDPTLPHAKNNRFIARYAYLVQPIGRSLDLNWIHNDAVDRDDKDKDGYFRNQGVGPWELNLAGFLADLNANEWNNQGAGLGYTYSKNYAPTAQSLGAAFTDARWFLTNRITGPFTTPNKSYLMGIERLFGQAATNQLGLDFVDSYGDGPVLPWSFDTSFYQVANISENPSKPWPGSDSPRHYFSLHDFFDRIKFPDPGSAANFRGRLSDASTNGNSHDRYTYYRMLAQLGVESAAEKEEDDATKKINLNYINVGGVSASQFVPWTTPNVYAAGVSASVTNRFARFTGSGPELWMNVVIERMLREDGYNFKNDYPNNQPFQIPVYTNVPMTPRRTNSFWRGTQRLPNYSPRLQQIVQLAANILEATTASKSSGDGNYPHYPLVFRPVFREILPPSGGQEIYIVGFVPAGDVSPANVLRLPPNYAAPFFDWYDLEDESSRPASANWDTASFYDIPWVFGTRKDIPNFNELSIQSHVMFKRYLRCEKIAGTTNVFSKIRQSLIVSITNYHITELAYPYTNYYPRPLAAYVSNRMTVTLWMDGNPLSSTNVSALTTNTVPSLMGSYAAFTWSNDYRLNLNVELSSLPSTVIVPPNGKFPTTAPLFFDDGTIAYNKSWRVTVSNHYRCYLFDSVDPARPRLVDSFTSARVSLDLPVNPTLDMNITDSRFRMWDTNLISGIMTRGVSNQLAICKGQTTFAANAAAQVQWNDYAGFGATPFSSRQAGIDDFNAWLSNPNPTNLVKDAPFNPIRRVIQAGSWQVNDPAVHYSILDMGNPAIPNVVSNKLAYGDLKDPYNNSVVAETKATLGKKNTSHYLPWGEGTGSPFDLRERDPMVLMPDSWQFPSHFASSKYPNVGWLGRVHRGTPWQTVYLKSADAGHAAASSVLDPTTNPWWRHVGEGFMNETYPTNDWRLFDIFTTAIYPNSTKGRLSINQTNLAAWSAVLSGVGVTAATDPDVNGEVFPVEEVIAPFSADAATLTTNAAVFQLVERMNALRDSRANPPPNAPPNWSGVAQFNKLSDLLSLDFLTLGSPYLKQPYISAAAESTKGTKEWLLTDADYERIPQQIAGLLKVGEPRFVVYAWGQSLKPAGNVPGIGLGIDTSTQTPRNYQVTGEQAMRAVVKVEFENLYDGTGKLTGRRPRAVIESFNIIPND